MSKPAVRLSEEGRQVLTRIYAMSEEEGMSLEQIAERLNTKIEALQFLITLDVMVKEGR